MDMNFYDSFGRDRRHGHWPPPPFGPDHRRGWEPEHRGHWHPPPFEPDSGHHRRGPHGGRGSHRPWGPERPDEYSSSSDSEDEEDPRKRDDDDDSSSDSSDSSSDSEVECHRKGKGRRHGGHGHRCPHRRGRHGHGGHDDHGRHGGHGRHGDHGRHGRHKGHGHRGHCWPPHGHGHDHRHGGRGHHFWPPHHHHHHHSEERKVGAEETLPIEDASAFGSDYQVIQNEVTSQMSNLHLQDNGPQDQSSKKCFKVALNADGFKVKEITIRRHQNQLLVEGKQNAKTFLGTFQRTFAYTINIPAGVNPHKIKTKLGPDGVLRIKAKKPRDDSDNDDIEAIPIKE